MGSLRSLRFEHPPVPPAIKPPIRAAAALLLAVSAACDSPTKGIPTPDLPDVAAGVTLEGRIVAGAAEEYELVAPAGEFRILLRATSGSEADTLVAELLDAAGVPGARAVSMGTDTVLGAQSSAWITVAEGERRRVRVRGAGPDDGGAYTLRLFARDPAPESRAAAIALGETVDGEILDVPGDVDEFTVDGTVGAEWIVFAQSLLGPRTVLNVQLVERGSGDTVSALPVTDPTAALEQRSTGRLRLPRTGTYTVRVSSGDTFRPEVRGGYRLRIDAVDRAPESRGAALALGDTAADAIHSVGDVDEFTFTAPAGQQVNLLVQLAEGMSDGLTVELLRGGQPVTVPLVATTPAASLNELGTGRITLQEGTHTVRISGSAYGLPAAATGSYRIELYPVDPRPEAPGEVRVDGAAVAGAIGRPGDLDEFPVSGTAWQMVVLTGSATADGQFSMELYTPAGARLEPPVLLGSGTSYGMRHTLPATGTYTLRVSAPVHRRMDTGSYSLSVYSVSAAPEHVPATLAVGQTQQGERIDRPGDLDVFRVRTERGRELALFLGAERTMGLAASVAGVGQAGGPWIFAYGDGPALDASSTGRFTTEYDTYEVVVDPQASGSVRPAGAYGIRVFPVNRLPEGRAAAYVPGTIVQNEPLYPAVDVDEYTFQLAAATNVRIVWEGASGEPGVGGPLGNLIHEDGGQSVWSSVLTNNGILVRQMTLPAGRYRLVVDVPAAAAPAHMNPLPSRFTYRFGFTPQ